MYTRYVVLVTGCPTACGSCTCTTCSEGTSCCHCASLRSPCRRHLTYKVPHACARTRTHARTHTRTHAHTRTHTHTPSTYPHLRPQRRPRATQSTAVVALSSRPTPPPLTARASPATPAPPIRRPVATVCYPYFCALPYKTELIVITYRFSNSYIHRRTSECQC